MALSIPCFRYKRGGNVSLKQWELSEKYRPENEKNPHQNAVVITFTEKQMWIPKREESVL